MRRRLTRHLLTWCSSQGHGTFPRRIALSLVPSRGMCRQQKPHGFKGSMWSKMSFTIARSGIAMNMPATPRVHCLQ